MNELNLKIKRLHKDVVLPTKAHPSDACFDIYAYCPEAEKPRYEENDDGQLELVLETGIPIRPGGSAIIDTGFATEIPEGYFAAVFPRSGMGIKKRVRLSNGTGIIDSSYRGEWKVALHNDSYVTRNIHHGDRIAQFALLPVLDVDIVEVDQLSETERGDGGFGSSGR